MRRTLSCSRGAEYSPLLNAERKLIVAEHDGAHRFDYVVSVMFENRSFDNLLGYLYEPGEVASTLTRARSTHRRTRSCSGRVAREDNRFKSYEAMQPPFNAP